MGESLTKLSKFLSLVLRHRPEVIGITLDAGGWADVDELIAAAARAGKPITREDIEKIMARRGKRRFAWNEDKTKIRAEYGHSIEVDLGYKSATPPEKLFHGTAQRFVESIRQEGLRAKGRKHVHLSSTVETAVTVGRRHGRPVVLVIKAGKMHEDGHEFYHPNDDIWLTKEVPLEYIEFPD